MDIHDKIDSQGLSTWLITSVAGGIAWGVWKVLKTVFTDRQRIDTAMQTMRILTTRIDDIARDAEKREASRVKQRDEDREAVKESIAEIRGDVKTLGTEILGLLKK